MRKLHEVDPHFKCILLTSFKCILIQVLKWALLSSMNLFPRVCYNTDSEISFWVALPNENFPHTVWPITFLWRFLIGSFTLASKAGSCVSLYLWLIVCMYHLCNPHLVDKSYQQWLILSIVIWNSKMTYGQSR